MLKIDHFFSVRVYYADTDSGGVVHHAAYVRFFEQARTESLRQVGIEQNVLFAKYGILLAIKNMHIEYNRPARLDDLLVVETKIKEIRKTNLTYEQVIRITNNEQVTICAAEFKLVCVNINMQVSALPKIFQEMENY